MVIHDIETLPNIVQAVIDEERPFHVIDNLGFCVQRGDRVRLKGGNKSALCQVVATTNEHQHVNYLVIGLKLVPKQTDDELFASCNVSEETKARLKRNPWEPDFDNREDWEEVKRITKEISEKKRLKKPTIPAQRRIAELEAERAEIMERQGGTSD